MGAVAPAFMPDAILKRAIREHFTNLGFTKGPDGLLQLPGTGKDVVRRLHAGQRAEKIASSRRFIDKNLNRLLGHFAEGEEIEPQNIDLQLIRVKSETWQADLFRLASLTWSVPVSSGFGRRMRYLVWDVGHDRLAGLIALGDPVFNLGVRDSLIGWSVRDRESRLVGIMDAYVLGAIPPYNMLLGGKAVACLVRSRDVLDDFGESYGGSVGIISGKAKNASLLAVTTSSSMGRSSVYNRLKLSGEPYFTPIGYTLGWGHFHITDELFSQMRAFLRLLNHHYADQHEYGSGPNWRLRTIKAALTELGVSESVLRHGIRREVFIAPMAANSFEILREGRGVANTTALGTVEEISRKAVDRWMIPRALRSSDFRQWRRTELQRLLGQPAETKYGSLGEARTV